MFPYKFINLSIFTDSRAMMNDLRPRFWDEILEAYYTADVRFRQMVWRDSSRSFPIKTFPSCNLVLTRRKDTVFKDLYHSPALFNQLPPWVNGYVNFSASTFVHYLSEDQEPRIEVDGSAHQFTHAVLPDEVGLSATALADIWPTWVNETWTVGFHQRKPDGWLADELSNRVGLIMPSISTITEKGIFVHDQRPPAENIAYQYCTLMGEALGTSLIDHLYPVYRRSNATPYMALLDVTHQAHRNGNGILQEVANIGLDINSVEREMRLSHRLPC